jgi:hypothetical protein
MSFIPAIDQIQLGTEDPAAWGTAVNSTVKLGLITDCTIEPDLGIETLKEIRGSIAPGYVAVLNSHRGGASISGTVCFEDLPYWFDSLFAQATHSSGSAPYTYTYNGQLDPMALTPPVAQQPRRIFTFIKGQTSKVQHLTGAIVNEMTIKMESNKPWTFSAKLIGKEVADGALQDLDADLLARTLTVAHSNATKLYIDSFTADAIGTTEITTLWFSAELSIKNVAGLVNGMGSLTPKAWIDSKAEATLKLKADVNADSEAYLDSILGSSLLQKKIRIETIDGTNSIKLDFAGTFSSAPKIDTDQDGVSALEFELDALYNTVDLANWMNATVINSIHGLA